MHVVSSEFIIYYDATSPSAESAVAPGRKFSPVWIYLQGNADCVTVMGNADCVTVVLFLHNFKGMLRLLPSW